MRHPVFSTALLLAALVGLLVGAERAAEACFMRAPQPVQVVLDRIDVVIHDNVIQKSYDCHFRNPNGGAIVGGVCYMELAPDAQIDNMSMNVNGEEVEAEILPLEKANQVFQEIVENGGNPALLEYYGNALVRTNVPNIPPGGTVIVKLRYTQTISAINGVYRISMLNTNPKMAMQVLDHAEVNILINTTQPLKNVYSPTHDITIDESEENGVKVHWSQDNYLPKNPFVFYYAVSPDPVGASVLTHKEAGEEGHFMVLLSPTVGQGEGAVTDADVMAKDIVFCVDTSGSMIENEKLIQAKAALRYCVEHLRDGDRFNIVDFGTTTRAMSDSGLLEVNDGTRARGLRYIENLRARGGTAIQEALNTALNQFSNDDRLKMIFFATDGLPTIGERDADNLLADIKRANTAGVRIFAFGEGAEVNARFLDLLAHEHRGESDYILPGEDIAAKISAYFDKVGSPMLADLHVTVTAGEGSTAQTFDVYPRTLPDLFRGDQLVVFGRYTGHGEVTIRLTGVVNGREKAFTYTVALPDENLAHEFVPRLWAGRKVAFMLSQIRKDANDQELIDEIVRLATRYGIVTPYTAFLATSDVAITPPEQMNRRARAQFAAAREEEQAATAGGRPASPEALRNATEAADRLGELRNSFRGDAYARAEAERAARGEGGSAMDVMRYIGSKTFYRHGDTWFDSTYDPEQHTDVKEFVIGTDEYFALLHGTPGLSKYLAPGNVVVRFRGITYRFTKPASSEENDGNGE